MNALSYNTERGQLHIPEYGRNVQNMIDYTKQIKSREERNKAAQAIIDVMGQLNPHLRDVEDYNHKLWTHLFVMSNFEIDVDSPYVIPTPEKLKELPAIMPYPHNRIRYGHFGHYAEKMIKDVSEIKFDDKEEKIYMEGILANLLKKDYLTFHTNNVENKVIVSHLEELSKGKLKLEDTSVLLTTNSILKQFGINNTNKKGKKKKSKKRKK